MQNDEKLLTKPQAAKQLGISRFRLKYLIRQGKLTEVKSLKRKNPMVRQAEVDRLVEEERASLEAAQ